MVRLFIAIPLSKEATDFVSRSIEEAEEKAARIDMRFSPEEDWHFTLVFLGDQPEEKIDAIKGVIQKVGEKITRLEITFHKLCYGPPIALPRMIWATTTRETSKKLSDIKDSIEQGLEQGGVRWKRARRPYTGHITLAKFKPQPLHSLPRIEKEFGFSYSALSIDLVQSILAPDGAIYNTLYGCGFLPAT